MSTTRALFTLAPLAAFLGIAAFTIRNRRRGQSHRRSGPPELTLVLRHVAKARNLGVIIRTAGALGVDEIVVVGVRKFQDEVNTFGAHGADHRVRIRSFQYASGTLRHLRERPLAEAAAGAPPTAPPRVAIVGIEILPEAVSVDSPEFARRVQCDYDRVCFLPGNEGCGLTDADKAMCDWFCCVPQYSGATASLNVATAVAIVLHRFSSAVGLKEAARDGAKYTVSDRSRAGGTELDDVDLALRDERSARKMQREQEDGEEEDGGASTSFLYVHHSQQRPDNRGVPP